MSCSFEDTSRIKLHVIYLSKEQGDMSTSTFTRRQDRLERKRAGMAHRQS